MANRNSLSVNKLDDNQQSAPIKDIEIYNDRLQKTYEDKCWWVEHIPQDVNFIIDLGCADAGIFEYIDTKYPNKYYYLGIDENKEMLKIAREKLKNIQSTLPM